MLEVIFDTINVSVVTKKEGGYKANSKSNKMININFKQNPFLFEYCRVLTVSAQEARMPVFWNKTEINKAGRPKQLQEVPFDSLDHDSCGQHEVFDKLIPEGFLSDSGQKGCQFWVPFSEIWSHQSNTSSAFISPSTRKLESLCSDLFLFF